MTAEPRQEVEVQGRTGEPVALPVGPDVGADHVWTLELPPGLEQAGSVGPDENVDPRLQVRAGQPGSYVLTATLTELRSGVAMTILPIRVTVV